LRLTEGGCDLLIAYHHASQPLQLNPERYEMLSLGAETLAPYVRPGLDGQPLLRLPGLPEHPNARLPFLSYAPGAYLAQMVELILKQAAIVPALDPVYETDIAEGLKAMALEGHGLAFLPVSSVRKELKGRRLVHAAAPGQYQLTMDVRIYRERPGLARHSKARATALWDFLASR